MGGLNQSVTFDFEMSRMVLTQQRKKCILATVLVSIAFSCEYEGGVAILTIQH